MKFVPERGRDDFFRWMENIEPWCISRQLWWGHQIPAWYGPDRRFRGASPRTRRRPRRASTTARTSSSSAIPTCSTPGSARRCGRSRRWAGPTRRRSSSKYYPTKVLVTGWDILFFWVARMMMMGMHFMSEVPFRTVYLHGLVTDEKGQKMSKSKGNVIDPLELIDKYGADALRFTMASLAAQRRRHAARAGARRRLAQLRDQVVERHALCRDERRGAAEGLRSGHASSSPSTMDAGRARPRQRTGRQARIAEFRLNEAADALYEFVWGMVCDWYVELTKPILQGEDGAGEGRDPRRHRLRAARDAEAAASR